MSPSQNSSLIFFAVSRLDNGLSIVPQSPILDFVDRVLIIDCNEKIQINRLMNRDNISEELAKKMIENQSKREERLAIADDVILNEGRKEEIKHEVKKLNDFYIKISSS